MKQLYYYQCQEDTVADFIMAAHGAINQMPMIMAQLLNRGDGHQRLIPGR
jgi:hypothetical protein